MSAAKFPRPPGPYTLIERLRIRLASLVMGHTAWSKLVHDIAPIIPKSWRNDVDYVPAATDDGARLERVKEKVKTEIVEIRNAMEVLRSQGRSSVELAAELNALARVLKMLSG